MEICDPPDLLGSGNIPSSGKTADPTRPLSPRQVWALLAAASRELLWGLPAVSREIDRLASASVERSRIRRSAKTRSTRWPASATHLDGAALFWILPRRRNVRLLRLLVAYQIIWDFLDNMNERAAMPVRQTAVSCTSRSPRRSNPGAPISDYYRHHPWKDDGGYLRALVESCREQCASLPSYPRVRPLCDRGAAPCSGPGPQPRTRSRSRDAALREWAEREFPGSDEASWFELSGAASASLTRTFSWRWPPNPHSRSAISPRRCAAYFPWVSLAITMLDSYVDQSEDAASGDHSYIAHYAEPRDRRTAPR